MKAFTLSKQKKRLLNGLLLVPIIVQFFGNNVQFFPTNLMGRYLSITSSDEEIYRGNCVWEPPRHQIPNDERWYKTIIAGYPSGDKRLTFMQLEALTGWAARDSWAFHTFGMTNHPFIKTNFPHHDGIWGWEDAGDQVILVVRNLREALVEFHHIMWDLAYRNTYEEAIKFQDNLYQSRPPLDLFLNWRDQQALDEIHWNGFFTDYWMEEGLIRDVLTHKYTTIKHWNMLLNPNNLSPYQRAYDTVIGNRVVEPEYDPNCLNKVSGGCHPVTVISANHLISRLSGPTEARKIAQTIVDKPGISRYLAPENQWECLWAELIINKKGVKTSLVRGGRERKYNFSEEMLIHIIEEYNRMIEKYSAPEWSHRQTAQDLVRYYKEYLEDTEKELDEVRSGVRVLNEFDFLGPKTRRDISREGTYNGTGRFQSRDLSKEKFDDYIDFFVELGKNITEVQRQKEMAAESGDKINTRDLSESGNDFSNYFWQLERKMSQLRRDRKIKEF